MQIDYGCEYAQKFKCYLNHIFSFLPVTLLITLFLLEFREMSVNFFKYFHIYFPHKHVRFQEKISKAVVLLKMGNRLTNIYILVITLTHYCP